MSDLIRRKDLYNRLAELESDVKKMIVITPKGTPEYARFHSRLNELNEFKSEVRNVPKVSAEPQWIPCSERLPEEGEEVLIATETSDKIYLGMYTKRYGFSMREGFICGEDFMWLNTAIAWMPLPEAYKGE